MIGAEADFDKRLRDFAAAPSNAVLESPARPESRPWRTSTPAGGRPKPKGKFVGVFSGAYFQMPNRLFPSGLAAKLGSSAGWLYAALCSVANQRSAGTFSISDKALSSDTGMGKSTIAEARKKLRSFGLIEFSTLPGRSPVYTLKPPQLEWVPLKDRPRSNCKPRGKSIAKLAIKEIDEWDGLPQILRATPLNFAKPYKFSQ